MPETRPRDGSDSLAGSARRTAPGPLLSFAAVVFISIVTVFATACRDEARPADAAHEGAAESASKTQADRETLSLSEALDLDLRLGISRDAKLDTLAMLVEDLGLERNVADGGGRGWIESVEDAAGTPIEARAGGRARINLVFEAGPHGIESGGTLFFQVSPFWNWDPPQAQDPMAPGYTRVTRKPDGIETEATWLGSELLAIEISGRKLEAGEQIALSYGAGPRLARVDRFAERRARLWFSVDGDGDGIRGVVDDSPTLDIHATDVGGVLAILPTVARPGEEVVLRLSVLDRVGNTGVPYRGAFLLEADDGLELPARVVFEPSDRGRKAVTARARAPGVYRVTARAEDPDAPQPLATVSNPLVVDATAPRIRWADLHGHSQLSDGTGTPEDYFTYARDVAGLDVIALTDHDHWGMRFLDEHPALWSEIQDNVRAFHAPGSFVTLLGYEWTSWVHGHRHVLYFRKDGEILSTLDKRFETPAQLWRGLAGKHALTFAHHSAGGPISTNWNYRPDPMIEPVTEIVSVHGSSEALDSPGSIYSPVPGNFVRDALDQGLRFGFIGSGDGHDGHPGASHISASGGGGLAAIQSEELTREGIRQALLARRTYATNGARIFLDVRIDAYPMGSTISSSSADDSEAGVARNLITQQLSIRVVAEAPLERVDLIRSGKTATIVLDTDREERLEWRETRTIPVLAPGEYHYVRVVQRNGGVAWSSPIFAE